MNSLIINEFKNNFRKKITSHRGIGIECEIPVVTKQGEAVSLNIIQDMFSYLETHNFQIEWDRFSNLKVSAHKKNEESAKKFTFYTDTITTDTAYSTIEIVLAPQNNLHTIDTKLSELLQILVTFFDKKECLLLGYGIQPITAPSRKLLMPKERYCFFEKLSTNKFISKSEGADSSYLNLTASNQCHVEIDLQNAITATNVLNALSGLQIALHANSPIWKGKVDNTYKANREMLWDLSFPDRLNQIGIPPHFKNIESYINYLFNFKPSLIKRNDIYLQILNKNTFHDFLLNESPAIGTCLNGKQITVEPRVNDIEQLIPFSWFNTRLVPKYGTIENRTCCQQPQGENLTTAAFTLGIIENLNAAEKLVNTYTLDVWRELRVQVAKHTFKSNIQGVSIVPLIEKILNIANEGLKKRNLHEELFLKPLYQRLKEQKSPADKAIEVFEEGGIHSLLKYISIKKEANLTSIQVLKKANLIA